MDAIGYGGPRASQFVRDARDGRWTIVLHSREDRDRDEGFVLSCTVFSALLGCPGR